MYRRKVKFYKDGFQKRICDIRAGYDIETTGSGEAAFMYHWAFSIDDNIITGRTWQSWVDFMDMLNAYCHTKKCKILVWVANLDHEFSFFSSRYPITKLFARTAHHPITVLCDCVEFRECLVISGQGGLASLAKNYTHTQKSVGDLDYKEMRNSMTPLTETELTYIYNDVIILSEWAQYIFSEYSEKDKKIPLTATGICRNAVRDAAEQTGQIKQIMQTVKKFYPPREIYNFIMRYLFRGGYTHSNIYNTYIQCENVFGADFTSSYPFVMLTEYYPMTEFIQTDLKTDGHTITDEKLLHFCCWFVADFTDIRATTNNTIESENKLIRYEGARFDNGRLHSADRIQVALTEIDYDNYTKFYKWSTIKILCAFTAMRGRLPKYLLNPLLHDYTLKNELKKTGKENTVEYKNAKSRVNSYYGMTVTRLNFDEWFYSCDTCEWRSEPTKKTYKKMISKQVLSPWWGIWVTAHARHNLLHNLYMIDDRESIYCDTDSIYMLHTPANMKIVARWNRTAFEKCKRAGLSGDNLKLGRFDLIEHGAIMDFQTLGAKRYIKFFDDKCEVTCAGMKKGTFERQIMQQFRQPDSIPLFKKLPDGRKMRIGFLSKSEAFDKFDSFFLLGCTESEKNRSIYGSEASAEIVDKFGNRETMHENSYLRISPIPFKITMSSLYLAYIKQSLEERRKNVEN